MSKNSRVGSLYYEIILDPNKFVKGASKVTAEQKKLAQMIKRENAALEKNMSNKDRYEREKKFIRDLVKNKKLSVQEGIEMTRMATAEYNRQEALRTKKLIAEIAKRKAAREEEMRDAIIMAKRAKVSTVNANEVKEFGGLGGFADKMTNDLGRLTMKLFPLFVAYQAFNKSLRTTVGILVDFTKAADKKATSLRTLTALYNGNEQVARKLRRELEDYSQKTSFSVEETMALAVQLRALGFDAQSTIRSIKQFGRLSFGDPAKMKLIAKAFSDVKAQGKLMATEVRQFANQGVPLLLQLQRQMGLTAQEVKDQMKAGLIGFDEVEKAIEAIADRFGAIDEAGLRTFSGQMEAAAEAAERLKASIAEISGVDEDMRAFAVLLNKVLDALNESAGRSEEGKFSWLEIGIELMKRAGSVAARQIPIVKELVNLYNVTLGPALSVYLGLLKKGIALQDEITNKRAAAAEAEARAEEERAKKEREAEKQAKTALDLRNKLDEQAARRKALETGDDSELRATEERLRYEKELADLQAKYGEEEGKRIADEERRLHILEKRVEREQKILDLVKQMDDLDKRDTERKKKDKEDALNIKLPKEMKQNSVEEWIYLKEQRDRERREAAEEKRHQEKLREDKQNVQDIIRGLAPAGQPQPQVNIV